MSDVTRTEGQPHDRLTRLCAAMTAALESAPEYAPTVKCVVFLDDRDRAGLQTFGYEDDLDAAVNVFMHLRAIFEANGKTLLFAPLGSG
jgi:hypothetical protein